MIMTAYPQDSMMAAKTLIYIFIVFSSTSLWGQAKSKLFYFNGDTSCIALFISPSINLGSHINGLGTDVTLKKRLDNRNNSAFEAQARSAVKYFATNIGIPGSTITLEQQIEFSYAFGKIYYIPQYAFSRHSQHTVSFYYIGYYSNDRTSQLSGGVKYKRLTDKGEFNFVFENDFLAFLRLDEFRTFASEINKKIIRKYKVLGAGAGLTLWTGSTKGLGYLHRNETYNLASQLGGRYSNGILYFKFYYNNYDLSFGYDSEGIRTFVQKNFHDLIDDGQIPAINRKGRIYVQISILDLGSLY